MFIRHLLAASGAALAAVLVLANSASCADELKPGVSLILVRASAARQEHDILFECEARFDNATGNELAVRSKFHSAFDGLELVVTDKNGKTLAQPPYTWHQSPFTVNGRDFILKEGSTSAKMVFPVPDLPRDVKMVKVRLVGTLPGSAYQRILSSETIEVNVKE